MADTVRDELLKEEHERLEAERLRAEIHDESLAKDYRDNSNDGVDWTERWNSKVDEIDAKIIDFFKRAGAEIEQLYEDVRWQFKRWAEDARENTEQYEREHHSARALRSKVDQRIEELDREGRIERQREPLEKK